MVIDPIDFPAQLSRGGELLDEQREQLAVDAADCAAVHPEVELAGLVVDGAAPAAEWFRLPLEELTGQDIGRCGFAGVVPRRFLVGLVRAHCPELLDGLVGPETGPRRLLPVLIVSRDGFRVAAVVCELPA
jgi:hypothetical protein